MKLGTVQNGVLGALATHGRWYGEGYGCGWTWSTKSVTKKVLESLVTHGLVAKTEEPVLRANTPTTVYRLTPSGEAYLAAIKARKAERVKS